jgi:hypothetical protein
MTNDKSDVANLTQTTFKRDDYGTRVREAYWTYTGMRSLNASFSDGSHHISLITHKNSERRQSSVSAHNVVELTVDSDDTLALSLNTLSEDGSPMTISLFGINLDHLLEAVAKAVAEKQRNTEDSNA